MALKTLPLVRGWKLSRYPTGPFTINRNSNQANGLVAWWPTLANPGTFPLQDMATGRYPLTAYNTPTWVTDSQMGATVSYEDGTSEYLEIDSTPILTPPFTISCWFNTTVTGSTNCVMVWVGDKDFSDRYHSLQLRGAVAGDPVACCSRNSTEYAANSTTGFLPNTWHFAVGIWYAPNLRAAFLDGANKGTNADTISPANLDRCAVGRAGDSSPSLYMGGKISDARIYNRALSDDEVWQLYDPATRWELYKPTMPVWVMGVQVSGEGPTTQTATHTTGATLKKESTTTHSTSAVLKQADSASHVTSAGIKKTQTGTVIVSATLEKTGTATTVTSAVLKETATATHLTGAILSQPNSATFATFATLLKTQTATTVTSATLEKTQSAIHTTDAYLSVAGVAQHVTGAVLLKSATATHLANAILKVTTTASHTTDATLTSSGTVTRTHLTSATLKAAVTVSHSCSGTLSSESTLVGVVALTGQWKDPVALTGQWKDPVTLTGQWLDTVNLRGSL